MCRFGFFLIRTAPTEIYTLSLHDALPICSAGPKRPSSRASRLSEYACSRTGRLEEHTSELQSPDHLVCRLLVEKKTNGAPDISAPTQYNRGQDWDGKPTRTASWCSPTNLA